MAYTREYSKKSRRIDQQTRPNTVIRFICPDRSVFTLFSGEQGCNEKEKGKTNEKGNTFTDRARDSGWFLGSEVSSEKKSNFALFLRGRGSDFERPPNTATRWRSRPCRTSPSSSCRTYPSSTESMISLSAPMETGNTGEDTSQRLPGRRSGG